MKEIINGSNGLYVILAIGVVCVVGMKLGYVPSYNVKTGDFAFSKK